MTRLLTETPELMASYAHVWPQLLVAIVKLLELPQEAASDEIGDIDPDLEGECCWLLTSVCVIDHRVAAGHSIRGVPVPTFRVRGLPGDVRPACLCWQAKARPLPRGCRTPRLSRQEVAPAGVKPSRPGNDGRCA
jgi:hypothetical protein